MSNPVMYRIKPVFDMPTSFNHSNLMYKLKNLTPNTFHQNPSSNLKPTDSADSSHEDILSRQEKLLKDLSQLQQRLNSFRDEVKQQLTQKTSSCDVNVNIFQKVGVQDLVVNADPEYPPYSLLWLRSKLKLPVNVSVHVHSSVSILPEKLTVFNQLNSESPCSSFTNLTFVWKNVGPDTQLVLSPIKNKIILGEVNLLRFFDELMFPNDEALSKTKNDEVLDLVHSLNHASGKEVHSFITKLGALLGSNMSFATHQNSKIVDIAVWSGLCRKVKLDALPSNLKNFVSSLSSELEMNPMDGDQNKTQRLK